MTPLVSVITPTIRPDMLERTIRMFESQDYPNKELIIVNGAGSIGFKRNEGCNNAKGEIIVHFDDDDYYTPDYISKSVSFLLDNGLNVTGCDHAYFHHAKTNQAWEWHYLNGAKGMPYVCEATMVYLKSAWDLRSFQDRSDGEGVYFLAHLPKVKAHGHLDIFVANIHGGNISSHKEVKNMKPVSPDIPINIINLCYYKEKANGTKNDNH